MDLATAESAPIVLTPAGLNDLMSALSDGGYDLVGPTVRGGAITIDSISGADDLPCGWGDEQRPGEYRLQRRDDDACFGFANPAGGWKRFLFPARTVLWRSRRDGESTTIEPEEPPSTRRVLFGIRGCDLAAIEIQDRVFLSRENPDPVYSARRENTLIVAANCSEPASTCFCDSMGAGPAIKSGADMVLSELDPDRPDDHRFVVQAMSAAGSAVLRSLLDAGDAKPASAADLGKVAYVAEEATRKMSRCVETEGLPDLLTGSAKSPAWAEIADRCYSCGNCTMVCPTCFCSDVNDLPNAASGTQERVRAWASCFELNHSFIHGGEIRKSIKSRYRQWLTHKFSTWWDQFGSSGCVGCGRCITWCPGGIDVTESIESIRVTSTGSGEKEARNP